MSSKNLSVATVIEKNKIASTDPFLVLLDIDIVHPTTKVVVESFRLARNTEDITYQGLLYSAIGFEIDLKQEAGAQSSVTLRVSDYTRAVQERMQAYAGGIGSSVKVTVISAANLLQPPEIQEFFTIIGASAQGYVVSWTLGAESILAIVFPKRRQLRDRCHWRYKSAECKYSGIKPTCDLTLQGSNGCGTHSNTINFGGFPGINSNGVKYA